jgi:hypothetical protein
MSKNRRVSDPFWRECFTAAITGLLAAGESVSDQLLERAKLVADAALELKSALAAADEVERVPVEPPQRFPTSEIGRVPFHKKV